MKPRDSKGIFIKTPKTVANPLGGSSTPPPSNPEDRLSGDTKGKAQETENQPESIARSVGEVELEGLRNTLVDSPVNSFTFLQPIQTTLPDFSTLKERVKGV